MKAETKTFTVPQTIFEITAEKETESETSLPDYLPNINRLIRVEEQPYAESAEISSGKAVIRGKSVFNVLYESDYKGKIYQSVFSVPFEQKLDPGPQIRASGMSADSIKDGLTVECSASSSFVGCKLLSPRKLLLKSRDNVRAAARSDSEHETPDKDKASVPTYYKTEKLEYLSYRQPIERDYELTESIVLSEGEPNIGEIVFTNASLSSPSVSLEDGRLTINADAYVKTLYENEEGTDYHSKTDVIPLSLTADDNVLNENSATFVKLWITEISSEKENDEYGEPRVINVSFKVKALISILENKEAEAVTDVFSPDYVHGTEKEVITYDTLVEMTENDITLEKVFETPDAEMSSILDCSAVINVSDCSFNNGEVTVKGTADISVLGKSESDGGRIVASDLSVTFDETFKSDSDADTKFRCEITPTEVSAKITGRNRIAVRAGATATLCGIKKNKKEIIVSSTLTESGAKESDGKTVICYPSPNETLWDISKRYSASPELVASYNENAFKNGEIVSSGTKMIIIPAAPSKRK